MSCLITEFSVILTALNAVALKKQLITVSCILQILLHVFFLSSFLCSWKILFVKLPNGALQSRL